MAPDKIPNVTFATDTIIPVNGCSPVGSTQVNFGPKSLNTELQVVCEGSGTVNWWELTRKDLVFL